jgi:kumamolisin
MPDESGSLVQLPGSERAPLEGAVAAGSLDTSRRAEITLITRRRATMPAEIVTGPTVLTRDELAERYGTHPDDAAQVREVLAGYGLQVTAAYPATRRIMVAGTLADLAGAFGTTLRQVSSPDPGGRGMVTHRYRVGALFVPAALVGIVVAVLGLDTRPQARPHFRTRGSSGSAAAAPSGGYSPNQVAEVYQFPAGTDGSGQTVAVIELGGGFSASDLDTYFGGLGIAVPSVTAQGVDGAANAPGSDPTGADLEVNLDIDVIGAAAPGAKQVVYFGPNNGDQGFVDAISAAAEASPAPIAISISWGQSEDSWTAQGRSSMNAAMSDAAALGITVCAAAGDNGSSDDATDGEPHCDFPASSPYALGCGGTKLEFSGGVITSEVVWNETAAGEGAGGGGVSDQFALPSWQAKAGVPARAGGTTSGGDGTTSGGGGTSSGGGGGGGGGTGSGGTGSGGGKGEHHHHHRHGEHHDHGHGEDEDAAAGGGSGQPAGEAAAASGGRGVPDVAGNADPVTGYSIYADGKSQVVGGTSAVAPLWAALISRLAQATGTRFGLIQPALYAGVSAGVDAPGFRDITSGNNGAYSAGPGWDACTGLGSPDGTALVGRLKA